MAKGKSTGPRTPGPSNDAFIGAWQTSASMNEVASKTGMKRSSVAARAIKLRKLQVPLKPFPRHARQVDHAEIARLRELAASLAPKAEASIPA